MEETKKNHASFIKIYIQTDGFHLNLIPIPLWLTRSIVSVGYQVLKIFARKKLIQDAKGVDIDEMIKAAKDMIKELKKYPPFHLLELENGDTKILIKTT